ncbi:unnamed protein product, partial [Prorocentrum cordatum]
RGHGVRRCLHSFPAVLDRRAPGGGRSGLLHPLAVRPHRRDLPRALPRRPGHPAAR